MKEASSPLLKARVTTSMKCISMFRLKFCYCSTILFSFALQRMPERSNEVSGLLIMGVSGGAIFPVLMGVASDAAGAQWGAVVVLLVCCMYHWVLAVREMR
jgi:fucose permease